MNKWTHSLRWRLLLPIVAAAAPAGILVALLSFYLGKSWALQDVERRATAIKETLDTASFPLSSNVISLLATLTDTQWITLNARGELDNLSEGLYSEDMKAEQFEQFAQTQEEVLALENRNYLVRRYTYGMQESKSVLVLFDEETVRAISRRFAFLPLLTGLSTIAVLSIIVWILLRPVLLRLQTLQQRVSLIAAGDFTVRCNDRHQDEIALVGGAVDSMAGQLEKLWREVNLQQATKLLHQLASGLAHQLRNTLTGSKMAIELYAAQNKAESAEEIQVALSQLNSAEDYVRRLLLVGKGSQDAAEPAQAAACLEEMNSGLRQMALHLKKELRIDSAKIDAVMIDDRASFVEAISNLILNAIHAAQSIVEVRACIAGDELQIEIADDGLGIESQVQETLFEPFVSTKPEGIGLGLPTVSQAAERLGGKVEWTRADDMTKFIFTCTYRKLEQ